MVEQEPIPLNQVFHALADATRRDMLERLGRSEHSVGQLAEPLDMSLAAASKHIRVLERAGLVHRRVDGRTHRLRLDAGALAAAHDWLARYRRFWSDRLDALENALNETPTGETDD